MKNNQESDWEKLIGQTIDDALHSGDFTKLKQTLSDTAQNVMKQTVSGCEQLSAQLGQIFGGAGQSQRPANTPQRPADPQRPQPVPVQRVPSRYATHWQRPAVPLRKKTVRLPGKAI